MFEPDLQREFLTGGEIHDISMAEASVQVNGELTVSDWFTINRGIRQMDTQSTTLFLLYVNDSGNNLTALNNTNDVGLRVLCALLYADNILLELLDVAHKLVSWVENKLPIMINKSKLNAF